MRYSEIVEHAGSAADTFDRQHGHAFAIAVNALTGFPIYVIRTGAGRDEKIVAVAARAGEDAFISPLGQMPMVEILQRHGHPNARPKLQQATPNLIRSWSRNGTLKAFTFADERRAKEMAAKALAEIGYG